LFVDRDRRSFSHIGKGELTTRSRFGNRGERASHIVKPLQHILRISDASLGASGIALASGRGRVRSNDVVGSSISNMIANKISTVLGVVEMPKGSMRLNLNVCGARDVGGVFLQVTP
jgi:hypothetical protein